MSALLIHAPPTHAPGSLKANNIINNMNNMTGRRKYRPAVCPKCGEEFGATYLPIHMRLCAASPAGKKGE